MANGTWYVTSLGYSTQPLPPEITLDDRLLHPFYTRSNPSCGIAHTFRKSLTDHHEELKDVSDPSIPHYAYFGPSPEAVIAALDDLDAYIREEGPFDGVLGFSQGASLAAMYLVRWAHQHPASVPPFTCAIMFSRIGAYDPVTWLEKGEVLKLERLPLSVSPIRIPVAAIWGNEDWEETKDQGSLTSKLFDETMVWTYIHAGGHEIPGHNAKLSLKETARTVRRAITQAKMRSQ